MTSDLVAGEQLKAFVERVERMHEERNAIADDIREIFGEARASGFDVATIKRIIKIRAMDPAEHLEAEALLELYMAAMGMIPEPEADDGAQIPSFLTRAHVRVHEEPRQITHAPGVVIPMALEPGETFDPATGEFTESTVDETGGEGGREPRSMTGSTTDAAGVLQTPASVTPFLAKASEGKAGITDDRSAPDGDVSRPSRGGDTPATNSEVAAGETDAIEEVAPSGDATAALIQQSGPDLGVSEGEVTPPSDERVTSREAVQHALPATISLATATELPERPALTSSDPQRSDAATHEDAGAAAPEDSSATGKAAGAQSPAAPTFTFVRDTTPLRPNCLRPTMCSGMGREHCHTCRKAAEGRAA